MKQYIVSNRESGYYEEFYRVSDAKKAMKEHNASGLIYWYGRSGDFECLGPIKLAGNNATMVANTRMRTRGY